jgi:hypothetical protein
MYKRKWHTKPKLTTKGVFRFFKILKILEDSPSHRIFGHMYGALNIGKKITNYTVLL